MISSNPLPAPAGATAASADVVASGLPIPPIERIRIFSDSQWEDFVLEWADSLRDQYGIVERCGGAGDMGRDIIAFDKANPVVWDNYQCKHYKAGLAPGDIWVELGKLVYYTHTNEYTYATELRERAAWLVSIFGEVSDSELLKVANSQVGEWGAEFAMESVLKVEDAEWQ